MLEIVVRNGISEMCLINAGDSSEYELDHFLRLE